MIDYKFDLTNGKNISLNGIKCPICGTVMKPERIEMKDYNIDYSFQSCSIERNLVCSCIFFICSWAIGLIFKSTPSI